MHIMFAMKTTGQTKLAHHDDSDPGAFEDPVWREEAVALPAVGRVRVCVEHHRDQPDGRQRNRDHWNHSWTGTGADHWEKINRFWNLIFLFLSLPKQRTYYYVCLIDGTARFFPNSYPATGNQTHVSSVAPLLMDLKSGRFTNWGTAAAAKLYLS